MNENLTSTKFIMCSVCLAMVYAAFLLGKLDSSQFMPFVLGIVGIYSASNTVSKFADGKSS